MGEETAMNNHVHPEFRTEVAVGELTVLGVLPGTRWRPEGAITIRGDVQLMWRDRARELADALRIVADRIDAVAEQRYGAEADDLPSARCNNGTQP